MAIIEDLIRIAIPPSAGPKTWLESAQEGAEFVIKNAGSDQIILFTNLGQALIHSVLAPLEQVDPPDFDDLEHSYIGPDGHWAIEHVWGGGQPDQVYLSAPLSSPGCKSLAGGEQLVFRRSFTGVDKGLVRTELSQPLVQALGLYWLDEHKGYCRLDENGEVQAIIKVIDLEAYSGEAHHVLVTIDAEHLHRYMAVTGQALVMKFDFTRYKSGSFGGWHDLDRFDFRNDNLAYHGGRSSGASFVNGAHIMAPLLTKDMINWKHRRDWSDEGKEYASFIAHDWKNNRVTDISCAPGALASYFEKDSPLPFQITPAFFNAEVLNKYKSNPEKYDLQHRSINARAGWHLQTYDANEFGQVHTYLCYLGRLPFKEQLYWKPFNEHPKGPISARAYKTDIEGSFDEVEDPLLALKYEIEKIDSLMPSWWKARGKAAASALHYPHTSSPNEWADSVLALDQFVIEGFAQKALRVTLESSGIEFQKDWGSVRLLQEILVDRGLSEQQAVEIVEPLKRTHYLRTKTKGHYAESERDDLVRNARAKFGSLPAHFRNLVSDVQSSFDRIVDLLPTA